MPSNYTVCCLNRAKNHTKKSLLSGQKIKPNSDYRELINPTWINSPATKPTGIGQVPNQSNMNSSCWIGFWNQFKRGIGFWGQLLAPETNSSLELIPKTNSVMNRFQNKKLS